MRCDDPQPPVVEAPIQVPRLRPENSARYRVTVRLATAVARDRVLQVDSRKTPSHLNYRAAMNRPSQARREKPGACAGLEAVLRRALRR